MQATSQACIMRTRLFALLHVGCDRTCLRYHRHHDGLWATTEMLCWLICWLRCRTSPFVGFYSSTHGSNMPHRRKLYALCSRDVPGRLGSLEQRWHKSFGTTGGMLVFRRFHRLLDPSNCGSGLKLFAKAGTGTPEPALVLVVETELQVDVVGQMYGYARVDFRQYCQLCTELRLGKHSHQHDRCSVLCESIAHVGMQHGSKICSCPVN